MNHKQNHYNNSTQNIAEIGIMLALTLVLEIISRLIFALPQGGSVNLGYAIIFFYAFRRGLTKAVILVCFNGVLLVLFYGFPIIGVGQFLLDYIVGYAVVPLAVALIGWTFKSQSINVRKVILSVIIGMLLSLLASTLSGVWYFFPDGTWSSRFHASVIYNLIYTLPTLIITLLIMLVIIKQKTLREW